MKRKLDENDIPTAVPTSSLQQDGMSFSSFGLDSRLQQAIAKKGFPTPLPVQSKTIPLALEGKDIIARSGTGTGKTAAYALPVLEHILRRKVDRYAGRETTALFLVPTRELAEQITKATKGFCAFCSNNISVVNLTLKNDEHTQRSLLADHPDIVVATPGRIVLNLSNSALSLKSIKHLVIDEADLVLSYGYDEDMQNIAEQLPNGVQTILMSATMTTDVESLKGRFCHDPAVIQLDQVEDDNKGITQYIVKCGEDEKFLFAYVIFKLKLIKGKCIVFVGDIDRCYRLKLFLEQFGVKSCVLNSELPVNSRIHVVEEFNKNVYDIIIAADEHEILGEVKSKRKMEDVSDKAKDETLRREDGEDAAIQEQTQASDTAPSSLPAKKKSKISKRKLDYGVSRGIDFQNVSCVLNFDLPLSSRSYTHRIGRTARGGKTGIAVSFAVPSSLHGTTKAISFPPAAQDETVLAQITTSQAKKSKELKPFNFDMAQVSAFRYRMNDALRAVTSVAVREARTRELRQEILKSEKLKRHFEENPEDLKGLRHDGESRAIRIQPHLRHVPGYLLPASGAKGIVKEDVGFVPLRKTTDNRRRLAKMKKSGKGKVGRMVKTKRSDPLKTFNARGRGK